MVEFVICVVVLWLLVRFYRWDRRRNVGADLGMIALIVYILFG